MKPVAIFRHVAIEGPGYLGKFLDEQNIQWQLIAIDAGESVPNHAGDFSGLVFMGGPMSVNDNLPWMLDAEQLIREAFEKDIPLLGHCLGGQLMSKALGGEVTRNPVKEIGWGEVSVSDNDIARSWFGDIRGFSAFHWHGESFALPQGATHILSSQHCINQAWAIGKHLALQCHVEMTTEMITAWCEAGAGEIEASVGSPAVNNSLETQQQTAELLPQMNKVAWRLYANWSAGLTN
ncbi:MAG: type 1 glutamine amidotransferase [Gallionella sp.]